MKLTAIHSNYYSLFFFSLILRSNLFFYQINSQIQLQKKTIWLQVKIFNKVVNNMKRAAPTWESASKNQTDQLYLYNSLTKQKVIFSYIQRNGH